MINEINVDLTIQLENKFGYGPPKYVIPFSLNNNILTLPFNYAITTVKLKRPKRNKFSVSTAIFNASLRDEQVVVKNEAIIELNKKGSVILSMYCGFGKTVTSIDIACVIKLKTLIIVNKIVLMNQWKQSIDDFCALDTEVQLLKPGIELDKSRDFYIINAQNIEKFAVDAFSDIGTVIVDEAHLIMAERISKCLNHVNPRYLIGLTATPYRPDGLDSLLNFYFGDAKIVRELFTPHDVYKIETGFKPLVEFGINGKIKWGSVLDSQATDVARNDIILRVIQYFGDRNILVLVKRIKQAAYLMKMLDDMDVHVTSLVGAKQTFDRSARVLIGTCSKVGTGFDHPSINMLLLATDVEEYFIQYLGRCMRTKNNVPCIVDLVDDHSILRRHYKTREKVYKKHGGRMCPVPDFTS